MRNISASTVDLALTATYPVPVLLPQAKGKTTAAAAGAAVTRENFREGLRVVRGKDWKWDDQDGGAGKVGVTSKDSSDGWCKVAWEGKQSTNSYRIGADNAFDLAIVEDKVGEGCTR
jgi:E3 ubiquitin-protein ligase HECTD1